MLWDLLSVRKIKQIFPCKKKNEKKKKMKPVLTKI